MKQSDVNKGMVLDLYPIHKRLTNDTIDSRQFLRDMAKFPILIIDVRMHSWKFENEDDCVLDDGIPIKTMFFIDANGKFDKFGLQWAIDMFVLARNELK